jgi:hypothetical protein
METKENILAPILLSSVLTEIMKFTPNIQWTRDLEKDLPKKRYGIELKIAPESIEKPPNYNHIRIFHAIATAILTAAPETAICSIKDDDELIVDQNDIPTTQ